MSRHQEDLVRLGMSPHQAERKSAMLQHCDDALDGIDASRQRWSVWVPGRIELFGKHTDYCGGRSLLCTVERGFAVRVANRTDARIRAVDVASGSVCETALDPTSSCAPGTWQNYVATVARRLAHNFPSAQCGVDLAFESDLPVAAGMSSSSALMIAVFVALAKSNDLRSSVEFRNAIDSREELASYLGAVENGQSYRTLAGDRGVGTFGGSQDHTAIMCGEDGHVVQYSFSPVRREAVYLLPPTHTFVVGASGVIAQKTAGARDAYNRVARLAYHLLAAWNADQHRSDPTLADAVRSDAAAPEVLRRLAATSGTAEFSAELLGNRLEHFLLESYVLIPEAASILARGTLDELGDVADRSQQAAERWLGNQVPETIALARLARRAGATAASSFGAGFGGSVWALVPVGEAHDFMVSWARLYEELCPDAAARALFFVSPPGPGAQQF